MAGLYSTIDKQNAKIIKLTMLNIIMKLIKPTRESNLKYRKSLNKQVIKSVSFRSAVFEYSSFFSKSCSNILVVNDVQASTV